jgi:hypothetical protein
LKFVVGSGEEKNKHFDFWNMYQVWSIFGLSQTLFLQTTAGRKIHFKLGKTFSSSNLIFETRELKKFGADR